MASDKATRTNRNLRRGADLNFSMMARELIKAAPCPSFTAGFSPVNHSSHSWLTTKCVRPGAAVGCDV